MSIASRITEIETHIGNAYTSIDNLGIDISNTNKNIYNISTLLDTFYESLPKVSGIGSNLSLSPSMVGKIKLNEIQGNTLQQNTPTPSSPVPIQSVTGLQNVEVCGKNLINGLLDNSTTGKKLERTINADENFYLYIKTNNTTSDRCYAFLDNTNVGTIWVSNNNGTLTFSGSRNFTFNRIRIQDNTTVSENMLTLGSTATTYEPYKGNTYEVNLGNIELNKTGDYEDSIKKSTGKNLFNATLDRYATNRVRTNVYSVLPNTTYTISVGTSGISVVNYYKDINQSDISDSGLKSMPYTFTTPSNCYYIQQIIRKSDDSNITLDELSTIMLNKGSTTLPYEPYGKVWYITKNVGKKIVEDNSGWSKSSRSDVNRYYIYNYLSGGLEKKDISTLVCNYLNCISQNQADAGNLGLANLNGNGLMVQFALSDTDFDTLQKWKTFVGTYKPKVLYVLSTPIYEVITNTELINQLETLYNAKSKNGTTNINVTSEDLSMILNVGVLKGE